MASAKKKATAKSKVKLKDLKSKKNPKGGFGKIEIARIKFDKFGG